MRSNNFAQMSAKQPPSMEVLMQQAQSLINEVSKARASGQQVNPALISAMMSIIEAIKQMKGQ
jgi:hypothetical protein